MNALQTAGQGDDIPPKTKWMQAASFPPCVGGGSSPEQSLACSGELDEAYTSPLILAHSHSLYYVKT